MKCERNIITMTFLRLHYIVYYLDNYVDNIFTETGISKHYRFFLHVFPVASISSCALLRADPSHKPFIRSRSTVGFVSSFLGVLLLSSSNGKWEGTEAKFCYGLK